MDVKDCTTNVMPRIAVFFTIVGASGSALYILFSTEDGAIKVCFLGYISLSIMGILLLGLIVMAFLNKPIGVVESFLTLLLFLLATSITLYVSINGFISKEDSPQMFNANIIGTAVNFFGSIGSLIAVFYKSIRRGAVHNASFSRMGNGTSQQATFTTAHSSQSDAASV